MKTNLNLLVSTLMVLFSMFACEQDVLDSGSDIANLKRANNGMIKSYDNTMVLTWNKALSTAIDNKKAAPEESRIYAMVSIAAHDALNNVVPKYETYAMDNSWNDGKLLSKKTIAAVADAAVSTAAHDVLVALLAAWRPTVDTTAIADVDALLTNCLAEIEDSEQKEMGIQIGADAAAVMLEKRQGDIPPTFVVYPQGTAPGEYRSYAPFTFPTPGWLPNSVYAPSWGETEPFGILAGDQFRPVPPYEINSPEYTADYNEVKSLGSNTSMTRTQDQTNMGIFLTDNMPSMLNRVARVMAMQEELNGWETARLFALIQMAEADALICSFEANYYYNFWRPITAITEGDNDGNVETAGDATWIPLQGLTVRSTPPLPSYPSGYAAAGRAGAEVLNLFFGTDSKSYTVGSYALPNAERTYSSFSQLAMEMAVSRIYVGHSFQNDNVAGDKIGKEVGEFVFNNNLRELK